MRVRVYVYHENKNCFRSEIIQSSLSRSLSKRTRGAVSCQGQSRLPSPEIVQSAKSCVTRRSVHVISLNFEEEEFAASFRPVPVYYTILSKFNWDRQRLCTRNRAWTSKTVCSSISERRNIRMRRPGPGGGFSPSRHTVLRNPQIRPTGPRLNLY